MRRFTQLYAELDQSTRTSDKLAALERYFREAPPADAAWALAILTGRRLIRRLARPRLRDWVAQEAGLPPWLVDECIERVGDLSETLALLLPDSDQETDVAFSEVVTQRLLPLGDLSDDDAHAHLRATWQLLSSEQRFVFHKLISGAFRVGASARLAIRAVATVAGIDPGVMQHRLMQRWSPTPEDYLRLLAPADGAADPGQPYPFYLASPLEDPPETLGDPADWLAEWKWDGIRAQLIRRAGQVIIWSRGEEIVTGQFPEIANVGRALPEGVVVDGEILAWEDDRPLPFHALQRRLNRKRVEATFWPEVPVAFLAFDLLELDGRDVRPEALAMRRAALEQLARDVGSREALRVSAPIAFDTWPALAAIRDTARERGVEGIVLKRLDSAYGVGRQRGAWWKWKIAPHTIDAVLLYAQLGSGKRASLLTDYTFGVWHNGELVPVAKAYSGLTDDEIAEVDRFVRANTTARRGPLRVVKPELVFELAFEGVQFSNRHKAGLALRFPRMARWRRDKRAPDADSLDALARLARGARSEN